MADFVANLARRGAGLHLPRWRPSLPLIGALDAGEAPDISIESEAPRQGGMPFEHAEILASPGSLVPPESAPQPAAPDSIELRPAEAAVAVQSGNSAATAELPVSDRPHRPAPAVPVLVLSPGAEPLASPGDQPVSRSNDEQPPRAESALLPVSAPDISSGPVPTAPRREPLQHPASPAELPDQPSSLTRALPRRMGDPAAKGPYPSTAAIAQPTIPGSSVVHPPTGDRRVPIVALPQAPAPRQAQPPEQRPVQVRIGRVEIRANQPAPPAPPRAQRAAGGFASMHLARAWLSRSFY
jgi:hypothetical protein